MFTFTNIQIILFLFAVGEMLRATTLELLVHTSAMVMSYTGKRLPSGPRRVVTS